MKRVEVKIKEEVFVLMAEKCLFWPSRSLLIISDLHLGKSTHFRKSGIPLTMGSGEDDLKKISELIVELQVLQIVFLGDLFHSDYNVEWDFLHNWINGQSQIEFLLVIGNHDNRTQENYKNTAITLVRDLQINKVFFTHEPEDRLGTYNVCGHIHPGVRLIGKAKQALRLPCFFINTKRMILPAFGSLTGLFILEPKESETIYGVVNSGLVKLN